MNGRRLLQLITTLTLLGCEDRTGAPIEEAIWAEVVEVQRFIPSSGDGYDLYQASHLRTLSDGRVVVLNAGAPEILIFSASGRLEDRFGRAGQGPGEFSRPMFMTTLPGDSILVTELDPQRGMVFTSGGSVARTFMLEWPGAGSFFVFPLGVTADRTLVTLQGQEVVGPGVTRPGMTRYPYHVVVYDLEGSLLHRFEPEGIEREGYLLEREGFLRDATPPLMRRGRFAAGPTGVALASTDSHDVIALDSDTQIRATVQVPGAASTLPRSFVDSVRSAWAEAATTDARKVFRRRALRKVPQPLAAPVIEDLQIDRLGRLWVAGANLDGSDSLRWYVFADDALLGFVELPAHLEIKEIGADYLLAIETSALGEESIVRVIWKLSG